MIMTISNSSIKRCRNKFPITGIGKVINSALLLFQLCDVELIIAEFICDPDNKQLYNVLLYLIRENCKDQKIIDELKNFIYE